MGIIIPVRAATMRRDRDKARLASGRYLARKLSRGNHLDLRAIDVGGTILFFRDLSEFGDDEFGTEAEIAAEAHNDRLPAIRINTV